MSEIKVYKKDKWVDRWVSDSNGDRFSWLISTQAPTSEFKYDYSMINKLYRSGLSSTAKGIFAFMLLNRFFPTRVCLYGQSTIAKMYGCANNTARKALNELKDNNIICSLKIYTGKNVAYQYVINDYSDWSLPENHRDMPEEGLPADVIKYSEEESQILNTNVVLSKEIYTKLNNDTGNMERY